MKTLQLTALVLLGMLLVPAALAQKGTGNRTGIAREAEQPPLVTLSGTLLHTEEGPCEQTTGRSSIGRHLIVQGDADAPWNVHLGPAADIRRLVPDLSEGAPITLYVFRTDDLPDGAYIAQALTVDGITYTLRDATLRPVWASGRRANAL